MSAVTDDTRLKMSAPLSLRAKLALASVSFLGIVLVDYYTSTYAHRQRIGNIDCTIKSGTCPSLLNPDKAHVNRKDLKKVIHSKFFTTQSGEGFGVIIGPSGTGKTSLIREICNDHPQGTLYFEVLNDDIPGSLARAIGIRTAPAAPTLTEIILPKVSSRYELSVPLPSDRKLALHLVLDILHSRVKKCGIPTRLFIDGADLIAKYQPELYVSLMDHAKVYANSKDLTIILVSSEGNVMPLIEKASSSSRKAEIVEVGDIAVSNAEDYLLKNGIESSKLRKDIVELVGGRLWLLRVAHYRYSAQELPDDEFFTDFKRFMFSEINRSFFEVDLNDKAIQMILLGVAKGMRRKDIVKQLVEKGMTHEHAIQSIRSLISANCLRYNVVGEVEWHSNCVKKYLQEESLIPPN